LDVGDDERNIQGSKMLLSRFVNAQPSISAGTPSNRWHEHLGQVDLAILYLGGKTLLDIETLKVGIQHVGETITDHRHTELKRGHLADVRDALRWVVDVSEGATRSIWDLILERMVIVVSPND
jgi:hypothetical protein